MNTKDERLFLSLFEKLVEDKNNSKYINSIIEFIDARNSLNVKNQVNGDAEDQKDPKSSSKGKEIIKNRKYLYKLVKNEDEYLQYTLDRLLKGISSGAKNSRSGFGNCLGKVLKKYEDSIDFDNLIKQFLSVYSSTSEFVLNKQVKYIYLGRLEIISQLQKLNYFRNHRTEHTEKIVGYLLEAYSIKTYLQDSSMILLMMVLSDLHNGNEEAYESVKRKFNLKDNNPSMMSMSLFISSLDSNMSGFSKGDGGEGTGSEGTGLEEDGMIEDEVLLRGLDEMKNGYPILSVYIYFLVERMKKDEKLFEKAVNTLNYMMESSSFNAVKVALITQAIAIFEVKNEHMLKKVFEKLNVCLKTVVKYYRYANSTNIKKFVNGYITMLSNMFREGLLSNKEGFNAYEYVYSSLSKMEEIPEEVTAYVEMHKRLFSEFLKRVDSGRLDGIKEDDGNADENDRVKSLESRIRYELLMKIGECVSVNNISILNPVVKSIMFSISQHSVDDKEELDRSEIGAEIKKVDIKNEKRKGSGTRGAAKADGKVEMKRSRESGVSRRNESLCQKLLEELKRDEKKFKYVLYLVKLLIIDNFYNLKILSKYISNEYKLGVRSERCGTEMSREDMEEDVYELYATLLVKYLGNLENKFNKLGVNELNNYYTILVSQVNALYEEEVNAETDDSVLNVRNRFLLLVKTATTKYNCATDVDDKRTLMNLIVMISVCVYLVLRVREDVEEDRMFLDYFGHLYKYVNNNEVSEEERRQLHYLTVNYKFNNRIGKQLESMFELVNGLVWRLVSEELDEEFCKKILKTTLTCDLNVIKSLSKVDYSTDDSSEEDDDDDMDEDEQDEDEQDEDESEEQENQKELEEQDNDESDDDLEEEEEDDDVLLNDYDKIYDELTTKSEFTFDRKKIKEEHSVKGEQHGIKEAGYSLLLNHRLERVMSLTDLLELLDDYVKSTKFNYNSKISKLIRELAKVKQVAVVSVQNKEELLKSKRSKRTNLGSNNNNNNKTRGDNNNNKTRGDNNNNKEQDFDVDGNVEMINKIIQILLYNKNSRGVLVNVVEIMSKIVKNSKLMTVIVNYMVFLVLTKRTNVNVNTLVELYKKYECVLNMFKILQVLSKNVMKSQLLVFTSRVIEMNKYYNKEGADLEEYISKVGSGNFREYMSGKDVKEDLNVLLNHVMQFSETSTIVESPELTTSESVSSALEPESGNSPKRVKIDENRKKNRGEYSSQYVKAIVVSINTMYHYVNNGKSGKSSNINNGCQETISGTGEIFSKIKAKVASIQHKQLKKYFNNIAIR
ncbi:conserved hypothetical protein [Theileria orientalis strain Shintoku]|uniref:Uncharacterized protein n=1 Tax=Theileria orientalis strain Shintoku TaxID=869250 RepID=J4C403_THEOR|nr:conserved hypothetical protein [Theileria orientalis strain Shintoku]BAM41336.1 conserved hypothetical protein [Theileria orientalis strain Shintoku]|eukprot:XP_009691637.1 conserved hypothetical protein [Theileria orientalis strain Shintoku]